MNTIALKSKLKRVLKVHSSNETSGEIEVETTGCLNGPPERNNIN